MMSTASLACGLLLGGLALTACVDELPLPPDDLGADEPAAEPAPVPVGRPAAEPAPAAPTCATTTVVERWRGTASRTTETYPDDVEATIGWERVETSGCTDRYLPAGEARYRFAIPGALCDQKVTPARSAVAGAHGLLSIDRSTSPATYVATGELTWLVTWTCTFEDGSTDSMQFPAGGRWLAAAGTVDSTTLTGTRVEPDGLQCGRGESATPCTYAWSFTAE